MYNIFAYKPEKEQDPEEFRSDVQVKEPTKKEKEHYENTPQVIPAGPEGNQVPTEPYKYLSEVSEETEKQPQVTSPDVSADEQKANEMNAMQQETEPKQQKSSDPLDQVYAALDIPAAPKFDYEKEARRKQRQIDMTNLAEGLKSLFQGVSYSKGGYISQQHDNLLPRLMAEKDRILQIADANERADKLNEWKAKVNAAVRNQQYAAKLQDEKNKDKEWDRRFKMQQEAINAREAWKHDPKFLASLEKLKTQEYNKRNDYLYSKKSDLLEKETLAKAKLLAAQHGYKLTDEQAKDAINGGTNNYFGSGSHKIELKDVVIGYDNNNKPIKRNFTQSEIKSKVFQWLVDTKNEISKLPPEKQQQALNEFSKKYGVALRFALTDPQNFNQNTIDQIFMKIISPKKDKTDDPLGLGINSVNNNDPLGLGIK